MLNDVERRRFLVNPTREESPPAGIGLLDIELDECASEPFVFPRSRRFAGTKPNDRIVHSHRLARLDPDVASDTVALVQEAQDSDTVSHRRDAGLLTRTGVGAGQVHAVFRIRVLPLIAAAAGRQKEHQRRADDCKGFHAQSGVQGW
jgi:hypothetical protein